MECKNCGSECLQMLDGTYKCVRCGSVYQKNEYKESLINNTKSNAEVGYSGADIFEKFSDSVVEISVVNAVASGFLVSRDGYIITNAHVVVTDEGDVFKQPKVKISDKYYYADFVATCCKSTKDFSTINDLALLKIKNVSQKFQCLKFADFSKVRTEEQVYVIGNSLGEGTAITSGIVSDKNHDGLLMYDCATNPGNSGGPVFNSHGLVIGAHVAGTISENAKAQGMNKAIPSSVVVKFLLKNKVNFEI